MRNVSYSHRHFGMIKLEKGARLKAQRALQLKEKETCHHRDIESTQFNICVECISLVAHEHCCWFVPSLL